MGRYGSHRRALEVTVAVRKYRSESQARCQGVPLDRLNAGLAEDLLRIFVEQIEPGTACGLRITALADHLSLDDRCSLIRRNDWCSRSGPRDTGHGRWRLN